jgi:hypothetical protein
MKKKKDQIASRRKEARAELRTTLGRERRGWWEQ